MKSVIEYTVQGRTRAELFVKAEEMYRKFTGNEVVGLPSNTVLLMSPSVEEKTQSGEVIHTLWEAQVHISSNS